LCGWTWRPSTSRRTPSASRCAPSVLLSSFPCYKIHVFAKVPQDQGVGCRVQVVGCRVQGAGCRVQGAGCRVQGHAGCAGRRGGQVPHAGHHRHQGLISHKVFVTYLTQIVFKLFPLHSEEDYLAQRVFQSRFAKANSHANPSTYFLTPTLISHQVFFKIVRRSQFPQKSVNLIFILVIVKDKLTSLWGG